MADRVEDELRAALAAAEDEAFSLAERSEMLMEIAMGLQQRPRTVAYLQAAVQLYERAGVLCPPEHSLLRARIAARRATALQALPGDDGAGLAAARDIYQEILPIFTAQGSAEEIAEAEMNLGLVLQSLAGAGKARITDAIAAYQRALRTFDRQRFPKEFAILQNNLATAFLAIPFTDKRAHLREALAVQAFEEGLQVVTLVDHPLEYAMLQNNLGNALQYASSSHAVENNLRALDAYDEALRVRTRDAMPVEYANTIANKANCLWNLPDDSSRPKAGNSRHLQSARALYSEARSIFAEHGEADRAQLLSEALSHLERELLAIAVHDPSYDVNPDVTAAAPAARQGDEL
jgi:tetratricopeptide (TPR) repeat protein